MMGELYCERCGTSRFRRQHDGSLYHDCPGPPPDPRDARIAELEAKEAEMRTLAARHSESADKAHARIAELEADRDTYKRLYHHLGEVLQRPCIHCGHVDRTVRAMRGEGKP